MLMVAVGLFALIKEPVAALAAPPTDPSGLCDRAAYLAASQTGVPVTVLHAIMLTETGRNRGGNLRPWPWTVNMEGKGLWFDTESSATAYAQEHYQRGARSFDIGCFQINYKWHHQGFTSLEAMFDPENNALYAARFLKKLFVETGDWAQAAGAYHSRTPARAEVYRARFTEILADLPPGDFEGSPAVAETADQAPIPARLAEARQPAGENTFPLLRSGAKTGLGSLVPLDQDPASPGLLSWHGG